MNKVTVKINGIDYNLKGDESADYLTEIAGYVDKKLKNLIDSNKKLSTSSAAILTAMNSADEMFKEKEDAKEIKNQFALLKSQISYLEKHNKELDDKVSDLDNQIKNQEGNINNELQIKISKLNEELNNKENILNSLNKEKDSLEEDLKRKIKILEDEKSESEKHNNKILEENNDKILSLNEKLEELKQYYINKIELLEQNHKEEICKVNKNNEELDTMLIHIKKEDNELKEKAIQYKNELILKDKDELEFKKQISNLEIKFKDYEENNKFKEASEKLSKENNSFKEKIENLNKEIELLTTEAKKYKELNKKIIARNEERSFRERSNFYKLKAYEDKYTNLIEKLVENQIKYICLKEGIEYKFPINILNSLGENDDIDIEDEIVFLSRTRNMEKRELKEKILIDSLPK